ncbi:MAG: hypothetical protein K6G09_04075 [Treponema sp.]|nr:hypothetical protein [Treponema sp.]
MKKTFTRFLTALIICIAVLNSCNHDAKINNPPETQTSAPDSTIPNDSGTTTNPVNKPTPPVAQIHAKTFKGQVYYLEEKAGRSVSAGRSAGNESGIDTTKDRIEFGNNEATDDCVIYLDQKEFSGTYTVDLESNEITIENAQSTDGSTLEGTLSFSDDAKTVELEATETDAGGNTTEIVKTGVVKWDWTEMGNWKNETVPFRNHYKNLGGFYVNETLPVQLWRGQIDFTYSAYTKGIQIPSSTFENLKAGDCIGFYYPINGNKLSVYLEGISDEEKNWTLKNYNYDYFIYTLSQESLDYINSNDGLDLYGDGNVLEGILLGSETAIKAAAFEFFSKQYHAIAVREDYHMEVSIYNDNAHNNRTISFYLIKGVPPIGSYHGTATDSNGISYYSPDKNIYREYCGKTSLDDTNNQITLKMDEYDFEITDSDDYDIFVKVDEEKSFKIKRSVSKTHNMTFTLVKESESDYKLYFFDYPQDIGEWLNTFDEVNNNYGFSLDLKPFEIWTDENLICSFTDLNTTGSWKTENVINPSTSENGNLFVWEGNLDFTDSKFSKGF